MDKDIFYFTEEICGIKLMEWQKKFLLQLHEKHKKGKPVYMYVYKSNYEQVVKDMLMKYAFWIECQELEVVEEGNMEKEIIDRAKWLYAYNGGSIPKFECAKTALYEKGSSYVRNLTEDLRPCNVSIGEHIEDLTTKF